VQHCWRNKGRPLAPYTTTTNVERRQKMTKELEYARWHLTTLRQCWRKKGRPIAPYYTTTTNVERRQKMAN
jgi:hypothetical protein